MLFIFSIFFSLQHLDECNNHPLLLRIAGPCKMHDLCKRGIIFGQFRIKELIGRRAQTAKKQFQRVETRPLFTELNGRYLSLTDGAFSDSCARVRPCSSRIFRRTLPTRFETGSCNSSTRRSPPTPLFYMKGSLRKMFHWWQNTTTTRAYLFL